MGYTNTPIVFINPTTTLQSHRTFLHLGFKCKACHGASCIDRVVEAPFSSQLLARLPTLILQTVPMRRNLVKPKAYKGEKTALSQKKIGNLFIYSRQVSPNSGAVLKLPVKGCPCLLHRGRSWQIESHPGAETPMI